VSCFLLSVFTGSFSSDESKNVKGSCRKLFSYTCTECRTHREREREPPPPPMTSCRRIAINSVHLCSTVSCTTLQSGRQKSFLRDRDEQKLYLLCTPSGRGGRLTVRPTVVVPPPEAGLGWVWMKLYAPSVGKLFAEYCSKIAFSIFSSSMI
jgi:hypothetical protein